MAGEPVSLMAHSLGSRVVLAALEHDPKLPVERALFMSGADSTKHAEAVARTVPKVKFTNFVVPGDGTLGLLGRLFTPTLGWEEVIGRQAIGGRIPAGNWRDVRLERADDHWDAYKDEAYWPLIREALVG